MASSPWQLTNVYKALRNFLISAGLLEPRRTALIPNKRWVSSEWLAGAGAPLPFSSAPRLHFWGVEGSCFVFFNPPPSLAVPFFSCPCLIPARSPSVRPWKKREPLCRSIFSSPFAMQCTLSPSGKLKKKREREKKKRSAPPLT